MSTTDAEIETAFPWINWREPITTTVPGRASGLACRLCVARFGLKGSDVGSLYQTAEEHADHIRQFHPKEVADES